MPGALFLLAATLAAAAAGPASAQQRQGQAVVWLAADGAGRVELLWSPLAGWPAGGFRLERLAAGASQVVADGLGPRPEAAATLAPAVRAELERLAADLRAGGAAARRAAATAFLRGAVDPALGHALGLRASDAAPPGEVRYRLSGRGARGEALWQVETPAVDARRVTPAPLAPADLEATAEDGTVRLRWTAPRGEALPVFSLSVERRVAGETRALTPAPVVPLRAKDGAHHGFADPEPAPGAEAVYRVTLHDILGRPGPPAEVAVKTPDFAALAPPSGLSAVSEPGRVVLTWAARETPASQGYVLERARAEGGPFAPLRPEPLPRTVARHVDEGVSDGTTYYYRLRSRARDGSLGEASATVWAEARAAAPLEAPEGLSAEAGRTRVRLAWRPSPGAVSGYLVERRTAAGSWARLNPGYSAEPRFDDLTGPQDGGVQRYRVTAVSPRGMLGAPSAVLSVELPDVVPPPQPRLVGLRAEPAGVTLSFLSGAPAEATSAVRVLRAARASGPSLVLGPPLAGSARTYTDGSARPGETYYYRVLAVDPAGNRSAPSEPLRATLPRQALPAPPAPRLEARARPFAHVRVLCPEPPADATLVVERRIAGEEAFAVLGTLTRGTREFVDARPAAGRVAAYRLAYRDAALAYGPPSAAVQIQAPGKE